MTPISKETRSQENFAYLLGLVIRNRNKNAAMLSSYDLCVNDALNLCVAGDYDEARKRLLRAFQYSVGILHRDYPLAVELAS